jgi:hypothetical protein
LVAIRRLIRKLLRAPPPLEAKIVPGVANSDNGVALCVQTQQRQHSRIQFNPNSDVKRVAT